MIRKCLNSETPNELRPDKATGYWRVKQKIFMASLESLKTRKLLASGAVVSAGTDTPVAIRMMYQGVGSVTSVTVVSATSLVTITTEGTKTYAFATYTTIGALAAAINGDGIFKVKILDVLQSLASANTLAAAALTTSTYDGLGNPIFDIVTATASALQIGVCLSAHRNMNAPSGHRVHLQEIQYSVNMGTAAANSMQVWKRKYPSTDTVFVGNGVETQLLGLLSVDTTLTTINWASGQGMISVGNDEEIIVLVKDAATLSDAAGNFVRVSGIVE